MFVPVLFAYLTGGQARPSTLVGSEDELKTQSTPINGFPSLGRNGEQKCPGIPQDFGAQNASIHQWSCMPRILRVPQNSNQPLWDEAPTIKLDSRSPPGTAQSTSNHHDTMESTERILPYATGSESLNQLITWSPGALSTSNYAEQNAYLERVIQVLKGQLQSAIDIQHRLNILQATDHLEEFTVPLEVLGDSESEIVKQTVAPEVDLTTFHNFIGNTDTKRNLAIQHGKDHCEHCPQTQSS
ncbi:unnamed protein product [Calypogeia fissa]